MVRRALLVILAAQMLAGCTMMKDATKQITEPPPSPGSLPAKEFATQKDAVCCYVGMKQLQDPGPPPVDWAGQIAALKAALAAKENENADLVRQLAALKARPTPPDLSGQLADLQAKLAAKDAENTDLARQLAALKARPTPPDLSGQLADLQAKLAAKDAENADLARQLAALKAALAAKDSENADLARQLAALKTRPAPFAQLLEREYFDSGSAKLKPEGVKKLKQLSADLKAKAGTDKEIRIEGHTDDRPIHTAQFPSNWELSSARANAVVRSLHDEGINGEQLLGIGYGASRPAAPNTSAESRAKNRRVEIILAPSLASPASPNQ